MELELGRHDLIQTTSCARGTLAVRVGELQIRISKNSEEIDIDRSYRSARRKGPKKLPVGI